MDNSIKETCVKNLQQLLKKTECLAENEQNKWVFRGQPNHCDIESTLRRECDRFDVESECVDGIEKEMIREFSRRVHHYTQNVPEDDRTDEWMALMRHHGAPSRLLDFTYSPHVAAFFAFRDAGKSTKVTVWAINTDALAKEVPKKLQGAYKCYRKHRTDKYFRQLFCQQHMLVLAVNPFRLNERLTIQKGVFLCPGNLELSFIDNLRAHVTAQKLANTVRKYVIATGSNGEIRDEALKSLDRMNIYNVPLFPGLDGFAQSFAARIPTFFLPRLSDPY